MSSSCETSLKQNQKLVGDTQNIYTTIAHMAMSCLANHYCSSHDSHPNEIVADSPAHRSLPDTFQYYER